jgi:hypothetical protein
VALVVESVQVIVPVAVPVAMFAWAWVLESTVTAPQETPATPVGVKVGADVNQNVPPPVKVSGVTLDVGSAPGVTASVCGLDV